MVELCPAAAHIWPHVLGHSDGPCPAGEMGSSRCPKQLFSFINLLFPQACESHLPQEPWQQGAVRARSPGQPLTWQSILSANEPGSQGT